VSGSGISWAICKSAPRSRQITTLAPHHSVFYRPGALPAAQPTASKHWRHPENNRCKHNVQFTPLHQTRQNSPVCVVSGEAVWFGLLLYVFRLQIFSQSATVLSCRESSSHRRSGRDTDKTVLSCPAWQCESASTSRYHGAADDGRRF